MRGLSSEIQSYSIPGENRVVVLKEKQPRTPVGKWVWRVLGHPMAEVVEVVGTGWSEEEAKQNLPQAVQLAEQKLKHVGGLKPNEIVFAKVVKGSVHKEDD